MFASFLKRKRTFLLALLFAREKLFSLILFALCSLLRRDEMCSAKTSLSTTLT